MTDYNQKNWGDLPTLKHLIIDTERYIVFIDDKFDIDWITSDEYDEKGHSDKIKHNSVLSQISLLECKPNGHFSEGVKLSFKRLLGEALSCSFGDDYKTANKVLLEAETYLQDRGEELSRLWYLSHSGFMASGALLLGLFAWFFRNNLILCVGQTFFLISIAMVAGALGALLSIIMRMGKEKLDCHAGKELHVLESRYRIVAGMLSALFISMAVYSDLFFPVFSNASNPNIAIIISGFIAGMSERLAPSLTSKLEKVKNK